jgi:hypothetical protein
MEKGTEIQICDLEVGERYCLSKSYRNSFTFIVKSRDKDGSFYIVYEDGVTGCFSSYEDMRVYAHPYTPLMKALL